MMKLETIKLTIGSDLGTIRLKDEVDRTIGSLTVKRRRAVNFEYDPDPEALAEQVVRAQGRADEHEVSALQGILDGLASQMIEVMNELRRQPREIHRRQQQQQQHKLFDE